jgi:hypothetical protein
MDLDIEKLMEERRQERQEGAKNAKAALFAYLAKRRPQIERITVCYSGSGDEGWLDEVRYFGAGGERIDLDDERLSWLVDDLFEDGVPDRFGINEGGDGAIHVYAATQKVVVEHNCNCGCQESETYEV